MKPYFTMWSKTVRGLFAAICLIRLSNSFGISGATSIVDYIAVPFRYTRGRLAKQRSHSMGSMKGKRGRLMNYLDAAERTIREQNKPLHSNEIVEYAKKRGWISPRGKTPANSLQAAIWRDTKRFGNSSRFLMIGRGKYHRKYSLRSFRRNNKEINRVD